MQPMRGNKKNGLGKNKCNAHARKIVQEESKNPVKGRYFFSMQPMRGIKKKQKNELKTKHSVKGRYFFSMQPMRRNENIYLQKKKELAVQNTHTQNHADERKKLWLGEHTIAQLS